jgi:uncharacterized protein
MRSPCVKICKIDIVTKVCSGCGRTLEQIANWRYYTEEQRDAIMQTLKSRNSDA